MGSEVLERNVNVSNSEIKGGLFCYYHDWTQIGNIFVLNPLQSGLWVCNGAHFLPKILHFLHYTYETTILMARTDPISWDNSG